MNYITKPVTRKELRTYAKALRELFDAKPDEPFPVLEALERLPDYFDGCNYRIINNNELPISVPAQCKQLSGDSFEIQIKQYIYDGACKGIGAYLGIILHEICHIYMYWIGYKPIFQRKFGRGKRYSNVEWQVKALTGEVAVPFEETKGMSYRRIMKKYNVSKGFAKFRVMLEEE